MCGAVQGGVGWCSAEWRATLGELDWTREEGREDGSPTSVGGTGELAVMRGGSECVCVEGVRGAKNRWCHLRGLHGL